MFDKLNANYPIFLLKYEEHFKLISVKKHTFQYTYLIRFLNWKKITRKYFKGKRGKAILKTLQDGFYVEHKLKGNSV